MAMPAEALPPRDHNNPPTKIEELRLQLAWDNAKLTGRKDELLGSVARAPETVESDEAAGKFADLIKLISAAMKAADTARVAAKEPHLEAGRAVDGFFKATLTDPLDKAKRTLQARLDAFLQAKAAKARREAEEAAKRQREEAERLAAQAAATGSDETMDKAVAAETQAVVSETVAEAKASTLSQTRGDYGAHASLRTTWEGEIADRGALDLEALRPYLALADLEKALRGAIKAGVREIKGARIFEKQSAVVR